MNRPRLLDLFCGAGGCARGYVLAGFDVTGVDRHEQPNYPASGGTFVRADALEYLSRHGGDFDVIHASPPCQRYTRAAKIHDSAAGHPDLVAPTRDLLDQIGKPWVIENVIGSPLRAGVVLCGLAFGLKVIRHRVFESSLLLLAPHHRAHPKHLSTNASKAYSTGAGGLVCVAGHNFARKAGLDAMGIDWNMTRKELANAIPPAYTHYLGRQIRASLLDG